MSETQDAASSEVTEVAQFMLSIAADLRRLDQLTLHATGLPNCLNMGPRIEQWADSLYTTVDQAARFERSPSLEQLLQECRARLQQTGVARGN
ncbi:hypothetical protein [Streptomyces sp. NPDC049915]|uniref:hypothetical protein n=1 Tax=Streptomyces sp. NPDC049915 TaxID=3155510 RepID=UPI00342F9D49